jgi:uncharacterized C2H2 Zn-finger protein
MDKECRLCLKSSDNLINVFQSKKNHQIAAMIYNITSIDIYETDIFSKEICSVCCDVVSQAYELRLQSIRNNENLKQQNVKVENPDDDFIKFEPNPTSDEENNCEDYEAPEYDIVEVSIQPFHPFMCDKCPQTRSSKAELELHMENDHLANNFCTLCSKKFISPIILKQHMRRQHLSAEELTCEQCGEIMKTQKKLELHLEIHENFFDEISENLEKTFQCRFCSKKFTKCNEKREMYDHMRAHKRAKEKESKRSRDEYESLVCPHCGNIYRTKQILQQHIKRHFETDKYACSKCPAKFKSWSEIYYHNAVHT